MDEFSHLSEENVCEPSNHDAIRVVEKAFSSIKHHYGVPAVIVHLIHIESKVCNDETKIQDRQIKKQSPFVLSQSRFGPD